MSDQPSSELLQAIVALGEDVRTSRLAARQDRSAADSRPGADMGALALEDAYLNLSMLLAGVALELDDQPLAEACAEHVFEWDPLNEDACRILMQIAAERSDERALRARYDACVAAYREYLNTTPSEQTQRLFDSLSQSRLA